MSTNTTHEPTVSETIKNAALVAARSALTDFDKVRGSLTGIKSTLAESMRAIGVQASAEGKAPAKALAIFKAACTYAEQTIREEYKATNKASKLPPMAEVLPAWTPNKSYIAKALERGLDLTDKTKYPNLEAIRKAVATPRGPKGPGTGENGTPATVTLASEKLNAAMVHLTVTLASLPAPIQDKAADLIAALLPKVEALGTTKNAAKEAAKRGGSRAAA